MTLRLRLRLDVVALAFPLVVTCGGGDLPDSDFLPEIFPDLAMAEPPPCSATEHEQLLNAPTTATVVPKQPAVPDGGR